MNIYTALLLVFGGWVSAYEGPCEFFARTESGLVCGVKKKASNGDEFVSFLGIPYAKPPLGELRFAEPKKAERFPGGIFNATEPGKVCPQTISEFGTKVNPEEMSEDCLLINVHVPLASLPDPFGRVKPLAPILVYLHGGSFATGSGNPDFYGPEYLLTKGIMLVTFNYRLNSIGFLSLGNKYIPGNAGLRDSIYALEWIQRNIYNFGGDSDQITFSGQSAGGSITHLLAISPAIKGRELFKRIIAFSGNAISNFFSISPNYAARNSELFLNGMNISTSESPKVIYQMLINASIEEILEANKFVQNRSDFNINFAPVIETPFEGVTTVIPRDPEKLMREGNGNEYTKLFSFVNNECQPVYKEAAKSIDIESLIRTKPYLTIPQNLLFESNTATIPTLLKKILMEYFNNTLPTFDEFLTLCDDGNYKYPVIRIIEKTLAAESNNVYVYEFSYEGENSILKNLLDIDWDGVGHAEDLTYFFRVNSVLGPLVDDEMARPDPDSKMKKWMTTLITNFVKTGVPATDPDAWTPAGDEFWHQNIKVPGQYHLRPYTPYMKDKKRFFDLLYNIGRLDLFSNFSNIPIYEKRSVLVKR